MTKFFGTAMAVLLTLAACSKEQGNKAVIGENAKLTISVVGATTTRAAFESPDNQDKIVNEFIAYIFAGNNLEATIVSTDGAAAEEECTTAANRIYVVANANDFLASQTITTPASLETVLGSIHESTVATNWFNSTTDANVWASGFKTLSASDFVLNSTEDGYEGNVSVALSFVPAKINVEVDLSGLTDYTGLTTDGSLCLTDVAILNVVGGTKFFGTSLMPAGTDLVYYTGWPMTGFSVVPAPTPDVLPLMTNAYDGTTDKFHFYVFENEANIPAEFPTIITLVATWGTDADDTKATVFFPIQLTSADAGVYATSGSVTGVERGKNYKVKIALTGSAEYDKDKDRPGTTDPTLPVVRTNMTVEVEVSDWIPVEIEKEFEM